jgi:HSP20 family protein
MRAIKLDPFNMITRSFFRPVIDELNFDWPQFKMTEGLDVYEEGDTIVVKATVPGIDPDKIKVSYEDGVLHIYGHEEEKEEKKEKKKVVYKKERVTNFDYVCTAPRPIDPNKISAHIDKGVLTITAPVAPHAKPQFVPVSVKK